MSNKIIKIKLKKVVTKTIINFLTQIMEKFKI